MANERQIGIRMTVDATSVTTVVPMATREFDRFAVGAEQAANRATRSVAQVNMSVRDLVAGAAGLSIVASAVRTLTDGLAALPREGFNFTKGVEVSQMGMAGILGSMTAINGQQTTFTQGMAISGDMVRKLNDDALRTAATSQELIPVFQALLAPGLSAKMTLDEVRQLTVVGTTAVKSMGLSGNQVVQELRDLVAGGITPASSTLASALNLKDEDIARAKASSEGLFAFLMKRMQGFQASSEAFGGTIAGQLDQVKEGAVRVAAEGMQPLTVAIKQAVKEAGELFTSKDAANNVTLNPELVQGLRDYASTAAATLGVGRDVVASLWEHRDAVTMVAAAYGAWKIGQWGSEAVTAIQAYVELAQASRLARVEAVAQAASNTEVALTSRQKVAALLAELQARQASAQADAAAATAQIAVLNTTREAIVLSRSETVAKMESARMSMAQAEAQIQAARAAGAQSFALATLTEGTVALAAAQARHAALTAELAVLGQQQARVQASIAATTLAHTAAVNAATVATGSLTAAKGAASVAARGFGLALSALGGTAGALIMVVSGLVMWLYKLNSAADAAQVSMTQIQRAEAAAARGEKPEERDVGALRAKIEEWKKKRDELVASGKDSVTEWSNFTPWTSTEKSLTAGINQMETSLAKINKASENTTVSTSGLTLTLAGTEQAWRKANGDVKTASQVQEDYKKKLEGSQAAYAQYKAMLEKNGANPQALSQAKALQAENEAAMASERDKALKSLKGEKAGVGAAIARRERDAIGASVEAVKEGYKLLALQTVDGMDAIDALRQRDQLSEYAAIQSRRELQLQDLKNRENAVNGELAIIKKKKDSLKEQEKLEGDLREIEQQRKNLNAKADRDGDTVLIKPQLELVKAMAQGAETTRDQAAAMENQNAVFGLGKTALQDLTIAQLEQQRLDLQATDSVIPGYLDALDRRIDAEKRLRVATGKNEGLEAADKAMKEQKRQAEKSADDISGIFRNGFANAFAGNATALASLGKSLKTTVATSIANALYDATLKEAVDGFSQWLSGSVRKALSGGDSSSSGLLGAVVSGIGAFFGGGSAPGLQASGAVTSAVSGWGSVAATSLPPLASAKGNVFNAPGLHSYVNTVVDRPTMFPFAKGTGLMGEAGPEAIMPLRRGADGRLGVSVGGGNGGASSGGNVSLTMAPVINVDSRSDRAAVMADVGRALAENNKVFTEHLKRAKAIPSV